MNLLRRHRDPSDADIDGLPNLCRCGCQTRVRRAIKRAAQAMKEAKA
jgi:isoquinoline 1-oxidoreductase alpha subunit